MFLNVKGFVWALLIELTSYTTGLSLYSDQEALKTKMEYVEIAQHVLGDELLSLKTEFSDQSRADRESTGRNIEYLENAQRALGDELRSTITMLNDQLHSVQVTVSDRGSQLDAVQDDHGRQLHDLDRRLGAVQHRTNNLEISRLQASRDLANSE